MLVLTRRPGESIVIGNGIKLTVVSIGPGRVKIGVEAPASVRVDRAEIHARIQQEQHEKASDVLEAVSSSPLTNAADQPTVISASGDTGVVPSSLTERKVEETAPPASGTRLSDRIPRKPR